VLGSQGDGGLEPLRDLFREQAALSTNSRTVMVEGATHVGLVDNRGHAAQTTAAILQVVEAARSGQPLGHAPEVVLDGSAPLLSTSSVRTRCMIPPRLRLSMTAVGRPSA
jgi:hypothetical protein